MGAVPESLPEPAPVCQICGAGPEARELVRAVLIRPSIVREIRKAGIDWDEAGYLCRPDLNEFRGRYIGGLLSRDRGELSKLELDVVASLREHELLSLDIEAALDRDQTLGGRISDWIAAFGGSWRFIGLFAMVLAGWILINAVVLTKAAFDPYPFIFLNLILSCVAAIQAPVIMMSQNRQEARDRLRSQGDYRINLKAELEIRQLHEKMDHLISHQWDRLLEIQEIQTEIMSELAADRHSR